MKEFNRLFVESFIRSPSSLFGLLCLYLVFFVFFVSIGLTLSPFVLFVFFVSICLLCLFFPKVRLQCGDHPCPRVILIRRSGESCFSGKVTAIRE